MPETVVDEPGIADSPIASIDPKDAARAMAVEAAEDENGVGEFVKAIDAGDGITDYRFVSLMRGYEGWQWSVTMFHDVERDTWTVNESTLIPMGTGAAPSGMDSMEGPSAADRPVGDRLHRHRPG